MLPQVTNAETIPAPAAAAGLLEEYAAALGSALGETPRHYRGPAYLPTRRAIRAAEEAASLLEEAARALTVAGVFVAPVAVPGGWSRPVDLLATGLRQLEAARQALEAHQSPGAPTPLENRAGCLFLSEWLPLAAADLEELLAPVCGLLGRVEP